ncbi:DUF736 family protein (plasmid) [Sinorhizobium medicae]|uniref:DUF736 family protein n=1 Tax=Sinorhizobium medicae TaxID=110321 RepID=UPI002AF6AF24|nr:DUF736 family protein [Sinorhizobium medicae]WQO48920.1 DUF736 family protein [Sinorhizobium medicae]WQO70525.1 DUF736 family protein [Sinorhizobium medicae]WQO76124.1 DUF736 family protein [Sinorhizobium medicae]WQO95294.1 DUF736 family protein [Sinorhizobium medicae]
MVSICRRWSCSLPERATSRSPQGGAEFSAGSVRTSDASDKDQDCLPTHRVYAKSARGHDIEVGGIWKKENQDGKPYYTLSIRKLRYNANLGWFPGQDDASLQAIIEWVPRD